MCTAGPPPYAASTSAASLAEHPLNHHQLPPLYSPSPSSSESTLLISPRSSVSSHSIALTGTYIHHFRQTATLVLDRQEEGCHVPSFGADSEVSGHLLLHSPQNVASVQLRVEGELSLKLPEGESVHPLLTKAHELVRTITPEVWDSPSDFMYIPFTLSLPSSTRNSQPGSTNERDLPPTMDAHLRSATCCIHTARVEYQLVLTVYKRVRVFGRELPVSCQKQSRILLEHVPRARPRWQAIEDPFQTPLKSQPEQWLQVSSKILPREGLCLQPLNVELFVPSFLVFSLTEAIPLQIHISGPAASVQQLLCSTGESEQPRLEGLSAFLRVSIVRQFVVRPPAPPGSNLPRYCGIHNVVLGEGTLRAKPPAFEDGPIVLDHCHELNWEGEVRCSKTSYSSYGSFKSGIVSAKDFVMVSFIPDSGSSFQELKMYQPIRLVTDSH